MSTLKTAKKKHYILKWFLLSLLTSLFLIAAGSGLYLYLNLQNQPTIDKAQLSVYDTSQITDQKGTVIWKPTNKRIGTSNYQQIPDLIKKGIVAVEDQSFWTHKGFDWLTVGKTLLGVAYSKINKSYRPRGGSNLEQQLIKNVYFNGGKGVNTNKRKIQELFLAKQLDENFSKQEVMTMYFNNLEYAEGDTGLAAIAKTYFGKSLDQFTERTPENIAQQAYLIGLGQAPSDYNLYTNPELGHKRMRVVLGVLLNKKIITKAEYNTAKKVDLTQNLQPRFAESEAQRQQNLKYKTYTDEVLKELTAKGYNINEATLNVKTFLNTEIYDTVTAMSRNPQYFQDENEQVAVSVLDKDGKVIAMVGGRSDQDELNRATQQTRSSGSSMKPFTAYGPLFEYLGNQYNTASQISSAPYLYPGTNFTMNNYGGYIYGIVNLQYALRMSLNTPVARIDDEILGSNRMKAFLAKNGLDVKDSYSALDGIGLNISTLQAATAYNAINNKGRYTKPRFIDSITFIDKTTTTFEAETHQAMNESTAFVLTQMLRGVPQTGFTAPAAAIPEWQGYAGKTGSVALDENSGAYNAYGLGGSDVWYDSITKDGYSISIWQGYDKPNESPMVADDFKGHQLLNRDLQRYLNQNRNTIENWTQPNTVQTLSGSGLNTFYQVLDSKDNQAESTTSVTPISKWYDWLKNQPLKTEDIKNNPEWEKEVLKNKLYPLFKQGFNTNNTTVLEPSIYNLLQP